MNNLKFSLVLGFVLVFTLPALLPIQYLEAQKIETKSSAHLISRDIKFMDLLYFKGKMVNDRIILSWMPTTVVQDGRYSVMLQVTGQPWETIGWLDTYSESWDAAEYMYEIEDLMTGQYFFRIKQVDPDGSESFSEIISLSYTGQPNSILVYPNPANDYLFVYGPTLDEIKRIALFDQTGQMILESNDESSAISTSNIPHGLYTLICEYGDIVAKTKVVVQ